ncbi:hypothetical protein PRZ48_012676 [Zasmidium cellare]|uniref:Cobalamin-independent methionine synthase MetE C-terminal/archaeal domain-containing protein n=1 Tax=Zasmidium cellare TaxID=395010 RepID=A0ABR0E5T4_ZASCE|nr:hypothetical protein PRZ48_012676 [Zasmidium cellare]
MPPPYRVDHVGSLIRPEYLITARNALRPSVDTMAIEEGTPEQQKALKDATEKAVQEVVQQQLQHGITSITTGEFERSVFWDDFYEALSGFDVSYIKFDTGKWRDGFPINEAWKKMGGEGRMGKIAVSKIQRTKSAYMDSWRLLRKYLPEEHWGLVKQTCLSPTWWHEMLQTPYTPESGYKTDTEYLNDIADALHDEVLELYEAGIRNFQIDDPLISMLYTEGWEQAMKANGTDREALVSLYVQTHNRFLQGLPDDMTVCHHMCRGNLPGAPTLPGEYNHLLQRLFLETNYKLFAVEWDDPAHGDFTPLKNLPRDKSVLLGLITTKTATLEDPAVIKEKLLSAGDIIANARGYGQKEGLDALGITTQCGFGTMSDKPGIGMTIQRQWEKCELMQGVAEEVWPDWKGKMGVAGSRL